MGIQLQPSSDRERGWVKRQRSEKRESEAKDTSSLRTGREGMGWFCGNSESEVVFVTADEFQ